MSRFRAGAQRHSTRAAVAPTSTYSTGADRQRQRLAARSHDGARAPHDAGPVHACAAAATVLLPNAAGPGDPASVVLSVRARIACQGRAGSISWSIADGCPNSAAKPRLSAVPQ